MNELGPSARRLLDFARGQDDPDVVVRNRVARKLEAKIAAAGTVIAASTLAQASAGTGAGTGVGTGFQTIVSSVAKSALVVGVTGALAAAGWLVLHPEGADRPVAPAVAVPVARVTPAIPSQASEEARGEAQPARDLDSTQVRPTPTSKAHRRLVPTTPASVPPAPSPSVVHHDALSAETQALRLAQQALRESTPKRALALLDEQEARFPRGLLQEERAAARILALCGVGRVEEARAHAVRFERSWPRSALFARIRFACWQP